MTEKPEPLPDHETANGQPLASERSTDEARPRLWLLVAALAGLCAGACLALAAGSAALAARSVRNAEEHLVLAAARGGTPATLTHAYLDQALADLARGEDPEEIVRAISPLLGQAESAHELGRAYYVLGAAELYLGHYQFGAAYFERAHEQAPTAEHLWLTAQAYELGGNISCALERYTQLASWDPAHSTYGDDYQSLGNLAAYRTFGEMRARAIEEQFGERGPCSSRINPAGDLVSQGQGFVNLGQLDRAIELFSEAIALDPEYAVAYHDRGVAYTQIDDLERALADFEMTIELDPEYALAYYNRGVVHRRLGDDDAALNDYTRAIALDPTIGSAYINRGHIFNERGMFPQAAADYEQALALELSAETRQRTEYLLESLRRLPEVATPTPRSAAALDPTPTPELTATTVHCPQAELNAWYTTMNSLVNQMYTDIVALEQDPALLDDPQALAGYQARAVARQEAHAEAAVLPPLCVLEAERLVSYAFELDVARYTHLRAGDRAAATAALESIYQTIDMLNQLLATLPLEPGG